MSVQTEIDSFKAKRLSQIGSTVEQAMVNLEEALQGLEINKAEKTEVAQSFTDVSNTLNLKADLVNGVVKSEQLPAFVKNIENAYYYNNQFYDDEAHTILITPSAETIYIDITGGGTNQYRWSGTSYILMGTGQLVTITTDGLMSYLDKIKLNGIAEGAVKVELSLVNGNILVNGVEFQVYRIADNEVTNVKLAQIPTLTIKGNDTGSTANVKDLTVSEVQTMIQDSTHRMVTDAQITQWSSATSAIKYYNTQALAITDEANINLGDYIQTFGGTSVSDGFGSLYVVENIISNIFSSFQISVGKYANKMPMDFEISEGIMGVRFIDDGVDFVATRYGITVGAVQESSTVGNVTTVKCKVGTAYLDDMMIYRLMRRGIFDNNGALIYDQDAVGYDDTLSTGGLAPHTHWVGVYIPKFYYRYNVTYNATQVPNINLQHIVDVAISDKPFTGAKVHEWFTDVDTAGNLVERSYRVASAFEGVAVNGSTGAYLFPNRTDVTTRIASDFQLGTPSGLTNYAGYELTSVNKANAQAPATNATLSNFRTMCKNRHVGNTSKRAITQQPYYATHAINILFMVYYASTDWKGILSAGVTNLADGSFNESVSTGYTSAMKNNSGFVSGIVRGTLGTTQVTNFKGIENFFGNVWKFNEGYKKLSTGLGNQVKIGIYDVTKTNDYAVYANLDFRNEKEILNVTTTSSYFKFRNEYMIPTATNSSSNYYRDYLWSGIVGQSAASSGNWNNSSNVGGFTVNLNNDFGAVSRRIGSRVFS